MKLCADQDGDKSGKMKVVNPEDAANAEMKEEDNTFGSILKDFNKSLEGLDDIIVSEEELAEAFPNCTIDRIAKEREFLVTHFILEKLLLPV